MCLVEEAVPFNLHFDLPLEKHLPIPSSLKCKAYIYMGKTFLRFFFLLVTKYEKEG